MTHPENWLTAARALCRAWKPLVGYELLMSLVTTAVLSLVAACTYYAVGLSGDAVLGNFELVSFRFRRWGQSRPVLFCSVGFGLCCSNTRGTDSADRRGPGGCDSFGPNVCAVLAWAAPRFVGPGRHSNNSALLTALPFLALGAVVYWLLLEPTPTFITFWPSVRRASGPRSRLSCCSFWRLAIVSVWLFARWALAVPVCVVESHSVRGYCEVRN